MNEANGGEVLKKLGMFPKPINNNNNKKRKSSTIIKHKIHFKYKIPNQIITRIIDSRGNEHCDDLAIANTINSFFFFFIAK